MFWGHKEGREEKEKERWGGGIEGEEMVEESQPASESVTHLCFIPIFPSRCNDNPVSRYPVHRLLRKVRVQQRREQYWSVVSCHMSLCCMVTWPVAHDWLKIMWLETHSPVHVSWCHWHWQSRPASPMWCSVASHEDPTHPVEYQSPERERRSSTYVSFPDHHPAACEDGVWVWDYLARAIVTWYLLFQGVWLN